MRLCSSAAVLFALANLSAGLLLRTTFVRCWATFGTPSTWVWVRFRRHPNVRIEMPHQLAVIHLCQPAWRSLRAGRALVKLPMSKYAHNDQRQQE